MRSREWGYLAGAGAIVVAAFLLRLYRIGDHELWLDEAFSFYTVTVSRMMQVIAEGSTPPLYYLLLKVWIKLAGESEAALRLLSAVAGTLCVAAVIWAGREIVNPSVGLWSGGVVALAPIHIYYSQEARAYVLLTLMLILTYILLWRAFRQDTWPSWALVSVGATFALYTHYLAILGLFAAASLVLVWSGRPPWRRYAAAMFTSGLLILPWILWSFVFTPRSLADSSWMQSVWERTPPLLAIPVTLEVFSLGPQAGFPALMKQFNHLVFPGSLRLLGLALLVLLGIWLASPWGDARLGVPSLVKRKIWLAFLLLFPLVVLWVISFSKPYYLVGRYDLVAFPAFALLLGLALFKLQRGSPAGSFLAAVTALLLLIPIGSKLHRYYQAPSRGDARATAEILNSSVANGDIVVFTEDRGLPVLYYLSRLGYRWKGGYCSKAMAVRRFGCRLYPRELENRPATNNPSRVLDEPESVREEIQELLEELAPSGGDLWVAFSRGSFSYGRLHLPEVDEIFARELARLNLKPVPVSGAAGLFRFQRS